MITSFFVDESAAIVFWSSAPKDVTTESGSKEDTNEETRADFSTQIQYNKQIQDFTLCFR